LITAVAGDTTSAIAFFTSINRSRAWASVKPALP